jgi:hypothetical protein
MYWNYRKYYVEAIHEKNLTAWISDLSPYAYQSNALSSKPKLQRQARKGDKNQREKN